MRFLLLRAALAAALTLLMAALADPAFAHSQLLSTNPPANAVLQSAPEAAELMFNEPVGLLAISLVDPDGNKTDLLGQSSAGQTVVVHLPQSLAEGTHVLSWRVASEDGHPVAGSLIFSIGTATGADISAPATDRGVAVSLWAAKAVLFLALFVGAGGAAFGAVAPLPRQARLVAGIAAAVGVVAAALSLGLQGLDALGLPLEAIISPDGWRGGFATSYGATAVCAAAGFLLALLALLLPGNLPGRIVALLAYFIGALALALSGHASAAEPQWLTRPAVFLHLAGILLWIGALLPLWLWLRDRSDASTRALATFSRYIPYAVAPLVLSGLTLAAIQLGWPGPSWIAPYTGILAAKLVLLIALFGLAVYNRLRLTAPALAGDAQARHRLRRSIGAEAAIVLVIIALVAGWRFTPPPRALAQAAPVVAVEPMLIHFMDADTMAMMTITPGQAGPVSLDIAITDAEGGPLEPESVAVTLALPERGIEPFKRDAAKIGDSWHVEDLIVPVAGIWTVTVEVRVSRFSMVTLPEAVAIR